MDFTKEQLSEVLCKRAERENGLQDLMEIMIECKKQIIFPHFLEKKSFPAFRNGESRFRKTGLTFPISEDSYFTDIWGT